MSEGKKMSRDTLVDPIGYPVLFDKIVAIYCVNKWPMLGNVYEIDTWRVSKIGQRSVTYDLNGSFE